MPWVGTNGTTSSSSLNKFGKTPKILKKKVEDPWTPSKQIFKPPNLYPPNVKPPKWQEENWKFQNFEIWKQKTFKIHMKKDT